MDDNDLRLDGNAAGGSLAQIFGYEMTTAETICGGCGAEAPVGRLMMYDPGLGIILRCASCDTALIRIARVRGGYWLDLRGTRGVRIQTAG